MATGVIDRGVVFRDPSNPDRQSGFLPSVCILPSGRWLCSFAAASTKSAPARECLLSYSDDEGRTWSPPVAPFRAPPIAGQPGGLLQVKLTALGQNRVLAAINWVEQSDPNRPFFNQATEGLLDTRILLAVSADDGVTWSAPRLMDTAPFQVPTSLTGPVLVLPSGEWAVQFELHKHYTDPQPWVHQPVLKFSRDQGKTWPDHSVPAVDPANRIYYWDQRPAVLDDGRLLDVFWTYDRTAAVYRNIHASESRDRGRTWSTVWDTGLPGQPGPAVSVNGGRILLVYVDRTGAPTIKARSSTDGGRTWPPETDIELYCPRLPSPIGRKNSVPDAWNEMMRYSVGLPMGVRLGHGDVVVVYYAGDHPDRTGIEWLRLRE